MGVLQYTGEQEIYVPGPPVPGMLGERPDVPRKGYGMDYLRGEVSVDDGWFVFGEPVQDVFVYQPELFTYPSRLPPEQLYHFWQSTFSYAPHEALAAVGDIMKVAQGELGARNTIFELPFEVWQEDWVPHFVGQLHQLLMAGRSQDVLRDDRRDVGPDPNNPHYTEVREGWLGASTVFVITRSRIARDEQGKEIVARSVELVKPEPQAADDILCELSLTEQLRLVELLLRQQVTQAEWDYVAAHADRRTMRGDHRSVRELVGHYHFVPEVPTWRKLVDGLGSLASRAADSRLVRFFAGEGWQWRREGHL